MINTYSMYITGHKYNLKIRGSTNKGMVWLTYIDLYGIPGFKR